MRRVASLVSLSCVCLGLTACASGPTTFTKADVSLQQRDADEAACWNYVLNTPEGRKHVENLQVARFIGGGVFSVAAQSAENSGNNNDPKKDSNNRLAHNDCMLGKGYKLQMG